MGIDCMGIGGNGNVKSHFRSSLVVMLNTLFKCLTWRPFTAVIIGGELIVTKSVWLLYPCKTWC